MAGARKNTKLKITAFKPPLKSPPKSPPKSVSKFEGPSTRLRRLEFSVFKKRPLVLGEKHLVIAAVSGGADSVACLHLLMALKKKWGFDLEVAHVHHGVSADSKQNQFRDQAARFVGEIAKKNQLKFALLKSRSKKKSRSKNQPDAQFQSEVALRDLRHELISKQALKRNASLVAMGHHADDLFETRLIRLLRGTGLTGLVAMTELAPIVNSESVMIWRPLLEFSRAEIVAYLCEKDLSPENDWLEDPSNADERYFRNALRRQLIPMMEQLRAGGARAMARSLQLIAESIDQNVKVTGDAGGLNREKLMSLSPAKRRARLAQWVGSRKIKNFSKSQLEEVLKRIDTSQKRLSFKVGRRVWLVDTTIRIQADFGGDGSR